MPRMVLPLRRSVTLTAMPRRLPCLHEPCTALYIWYSLTTELPRPLRQTARNRGWARLRPVMTSAVLSPQERQFIKVSFGIHRPFIAVCYLFRLGGGLSESRGLHAKLCRGTEVNECSRRTPVPRVLPRALQGDTWC